MSYAYWPTGYWPGLASAAPARPLRDAGFLRAATITGSTKRAPATSSGKRAAPAPHLASIRLTPLDPVDAETRQRLALNTPHELLQAFADGGLDIVEGDLLVVGGVEYPVRSAGQWAWRGSEFVHLVLEELKR